MKAKKFLKEKQNLWIGFMLLALGILMFLYWGNQKELWFCDEIYSYESANGIEQDWPANSQNQWMSGADVEAFFSADSEQLSYEAITVRLYCDHVPLYFWIFRTISFFFFKGSGSIWIGLSINLFFYLGLILLIYKIFIYLTKSPILAAIITIFSMVINRVMMMQATMLRMYVMLVFAEILLLFASIKILIEINSGKKMWKSFLLLYVASLFGFLIHYDFWIFYGCTAAISCLYLFWKSIKEKGIKFFLANDFKYVIFWIINFGLAIGSELLIFPYSRWNLNRGKGQMALHEIVDFSSTKFEQILWGYNRLGASFFGDKVPNIIGLCIFAFMLAAGIYILSKKKEYNKRLIFVVTLLTSQIYQFAVCFVMPDVNEERYLWGGFTLVHIISIWGGILLFQSIFERYKIKKSYRFLSAFIFFIGISIFSWVSMDGGDAIMYLTHPDKDMQLLEENKEIPWIVYGPTVGVYSYYDWIMPEQICFLSEEKNEDRDLAIQKLQDYDQVILYAEEGLVPQLKTALEVELDKRVEVEYLTKSTNLSVYLLDISNE